MLYREIIVVCSEIHTKHTHIVGAECRIFKIPEIEVAYTYFARYSRTEILVF
jgi:hypothetical protein